MFRSAIIAAAVGLAGISGAAAAEWQVAIPGEYSSCDLFGAGAGNLCRMDLGTSVLFRFQGSQQISLFSAPAGTKVLSSSWKPFSGGAVAICNTGVVLYQGNNMAPSNYYGSAVFVPDAAWARRTPAN